MPDEGATPATHTATAASLTIAAATVAFATAVVVTTEFIVIGLLPIMARDLQVSIPSAGRLVSWFALSAALLGPPMTMLAARFTPRAVLIAVSACFAVGNFVTAAAPGYQVAVAMRIFEGATLPVMISIGSAALAQLVGLGREGRAVALLYVGVVAAFALLVPAGVLVAERAGWAASFFGLGVLATAAALLLALLFPRLRLAGTVAMRGQARILRRVDVLVQLLLAGLLIAATFAAYTYLAAWLETVAGYGNQRIAAVLTGFGAMGVAGNWIAGRLADRVPAWAGIIVAAALVLVLVGMSLAGGDARIFVPLLAVWGMTQAAVLLLCQVETMRAAPEAPAFAAALNLSAGNVGIAAGAALGGWAISRWGIAWIGGAGAVPAVAALALALWLQRWTALPRRPVR